MNQKTDESTALMFRKQAALIGAFVADAACMGLHWLYDVDRIRQVAGDVPEFMNPDFKHYDGVTSYFAHGMKEAGDFSHYGEQLFVTLQSLLNNKVEYSKKAYQKDFCDYFGPGGPFVGYIDGPTRDTLKNVEEGTLQAAEEVSKMDLGIDAETQSMLLRKILPNYKNYPEEGLEARIDEAIRITTDDDEIVKKGLIMLDAIRKKMDGYFGSAEDQQLPAISKLPAILVRYAGDPELNNIIESAVRVTNNNDTAVNYALAAGKMIDAALNGRSVIEAIEAGLSVASSEVVEQLNEGVNAAGQDSVEAVGKFGRDCGLRQGTKSALQIMLSTTSYKQAIRTNIMAGGDSCGRSILIGALLGAVYGIWTANGVPLDWLARVKNNHKIIVMSQQISQ